LTHISINIHRSVYNIKLGENLQLYYISFYILYYLYIN